MKIALFGAGGKMGCRIADNLKGSAHDMLYVEPSEAGLSRLRERGLATTSAEEATAVADAIILAVPDILIGRVAVQVVPDLRSGAMLIVLDAAAPWGRELPARADITYIVTHPCHPSVFNEAADAPAARRDFFGGVSATQDVVCALMQGPETDYEPARAIVAEMFHPVRTVHRVTVDQMLLLEPVLAETTAATCMLVIREALDEAIARGVPAEAARSFLLGHLNIELAIVFGEVDSPFSDGALAAMREARQRLFQPNWKSVFDADAIEASVDAILAGGGTQLRRLPR